MSVLQTVQKNNRQFTYGQTVQKNNKQFTYGQTVQKNNKQFTYGQTVQKNCTGAFTVLQTVQKKQQQFTYGQTVQKNNSNLHMDRQCKKTTAIYLWTDSAKKQQTIYLWTDSAKKLHWSIYSAPDSAKKTTAIYIWTDSAKKQQQFTYGQTVQKNNKQFTYGQTVQKNCTGAFTVLQTVQKKQQQFTYGQTVQKNNKQFTYGQTVQKNCTGAFTVLQCHESGSHSLKLHITHGLHFPSCTALTHSRPPLHRSHSCHHSLINSDCLTTPAPHSLTHIKAAHKHSPSAKSCFPLVTFLSVLLFILLFLCFTPDCLTLNL